MTESDDRTHKELTREAARLFGAGYHCSEILFLLAMKAWARAVEPDLIRIASGFGGGIGDCGDVCGCVTGGVMAIGLLHGRTDASDKHPLAEELSKTYRDRFVEVNGFLDCRDYTGGTFSLGTRRRCTKVVMRSLDALLDILAEQGGKPSPWRRDSLRAFTSPRKKDAG